MTRSVGEKVRITTCDGEFEGIVHLVQKETITLSKVKICGKENVELPGRQNFYSHELESIKFLSGVSDEELCGPQQPLPQSNGCVSATNNRRQGSSRKSIMAQKHVPSHIMAMRDIKQESLILKIAPATSSLKSVPEERAPPERPHGKHEYILVDSVDDKFKEIIQHIQTYPIVGLAMEAVNPGREGQLCWLQIAVTERIFLFDVLTMGKQCFAQGLRAILESGEILKVVHDCRLLADMLWHKFSVKLISVFDTQVADVFVYRLHNGGDFPRYVQGLSVCLFDHLGLAPHDVFQARYRSHNMMEDQAVWKERPAPPNVLEAAVKNVAYIRELRLVLIEKLLSEYTAAVDIYLKYVTEASFSDAHRYSKTNHLLPLAFQDLPVNMEIRSNDYVRRRSWPVRNPPHDKSGFQENCDGVVDPAIKYARDSVIHANINNLAPPSPPQAPKLDSTSLANKGETILMEMDDASIDNNISSSNVTQSDTRKQSPRVMNQLLATLSSDDLAAVIKLPQNNSKKMSKTVCRQEENTGIKSLANNHINNATVQPEEMSDNAELLNIRQVSRRSFDHIQNDHDDEDNGDDDDDDDEFFEIPNSVKVTVCPYINAIVPNPVDWESVLSECHPSDLSGLRLVPAGHKLSMDVSPNPPKQPDYIAHTGNRMNKRYSYSQPHPVVSASVNRPNARYSYSPPHGIVSSDDRDAIYSTRSDDTRNQSSMHIRSETFSTEAQSVAQTMNLHSGNVDHSVVSSDTDDDDMDMIISILKSHRRMKSDTKKTNINSQIEPKHLPNSNVSNGITVTPGYMNSSVSRNMKHIGRTRVTTFLDDEAIIMATVQQRDGITNKRELGASDSDSSIASSEPSKKVTSDCSKSTNLDSDSSNTENDTTPLNGLFTLFEQSSRTSTPR